MAKTRRPLVGDENFPKRSSVITTETLIKQYAETENKRFVNDRQVADWTKAANLVLADGEDDEPTTIKIANLLTAEEKAKLTQNSQLYYDSTLNDFTSDKGDTVSITRFGADRTGAVNSTSALVAAVAYLTTNFGGKGTIWYPPGTYLQGTFNQVISGITIAATYGTVVINSTNAQNQPFSGIWNGCTLRGLIINSNAHVKAGGVYLAGSDNVIEYCKLLNTGDTGFTIEAIPLGGGSAVATKNNLIRHCIVQGQKFYHESGGKSPFIAGYYAEDTTFEDCIAIDCNADPFDSDDGKGTTTFRRCIAIRNGGRAYAAFHSEGNGDPASPNNTVKWIDCIAINHVIAFNQTENAKIFIENCVADTCEYIFKSGASSLPEIDGIKAFNCGSNALAASLTEGLFTIPLGGNIKRVVTKNSNAAQILCNYDGSGQNHNNTLSFTDFDIDKDIKFAYEGSGARKLVFTDGIFRGTSGYKYYNALNQTVESTRIFFENGGIQGARIVSHLLLDCIFRKTGNSGLHIDIQINDLVNTTTVKCVFIGGGAFSNYAPTSTSNNNVYINLATPPTTNLLNGVVRGRTDTLRSLLIDNMNQDHASGFYSVNADQQTGLYYFAWVIRHDNGGTDTHWADQWRVALETGIVEHRVVKDSSEGVSYTAIPWKEMLDQRNFPVVPRLNPTATSQLAFRSGVWNIVDKYIQNTNNDSVATIWYLLLKMPLSTSSTLDHSHFFVSIGGWASNEKKVIEVSAGNRGGTTINYRVLGSGQGTIEAYNTGTETYIFAKAGTFSAIGVDYGHLLGGAIGYDVIATTNVTPVGTKVFDSAVTPSQENSFVTKTLAPFLNQQAWELNDLIIYDGDEFIRKPLTELIIGSDFREHYSDVFYNASLVGKGVGVLTSDVNGSGSKLDSLYGSGPESGLSLHKGTTATGHAFLGTSVEFCNPIVTGKKYAGEWVFEIPALSDGTNTFEAFFGFCTQTSTLTNAIGLFINGPTFTFRTRSGGSNIGPSTIQLTDRQPNKRYRVRIEFNGTIARCYFMEEPSTYVNHKKWVWTSFDQVIGTLTAGVDGTVFPVSKYSICAFIKGSVGIVDKTIIIPMTSVEKVKV